MGKERLTQGDDCLYKILSLLSCFKALDIFLTYFGLRWFKNEIPSRRYIYSRYFFTTDTMDKKIWD